MWPQCSDTIVGRAARATDATSDAASAPSRSASGGKARATTVTARAASRDPRVVSVERRRHAGVGERAHRVVATRWTLVERVIVRQRRDVDVLAEPGRARRCKREALAARRSARRQRTLEVHQAHVAVEQRGVGKRRRRQRGAELQVARRCHAQRLGAPTADERERERQCRERERCYSRPTMELLVLGLVAGIGFASYALWHKARKDEGDALTAEQKRLAPPSSARPRRSRSATSCSTSAPTFSSRAWSPSARTAAARASTASSTTATSASSTPRPAAPIRCCWRPPPTAPTRATAIRRRACAHAGGAYRQTARAQASAIRVGQLGARKHSDRVRVFEYAGPGPARMLVVDWGDKLEAFAGERILASAIEILPAR